MRRSGDSGMVEVYLARDERLERHVDASTGDTFDAMLEHRASPSRRQRLREPDRPRAASVS